LRAGATWAIRRSCCCEDLSYGRNRWLVNRVFSAASHSRITITLTSTFYFNNDYTSNSITLHTSKGCEVDNSTSGAATGSSGTADTPFSGTMSTDDCDVKAPGQDENVGCSIHAPESMSSVQMGGTDNTAIPLAMYGTNFNKAGRGFYATEWTKKSISVWFFPRNYPAFTQYFGASQNTPTGITSSDPSTWGPPIAHFAGTGCDFTERFKDLKIIFNTAFFGDRTGKE
jgi:hypothetical protein